MNKAANYKSDEIDDILKSIQPEESYRIEQRMLLALKIIKAMKAKGLSKIGFAEKMDKHPSVITNWLSGTHNFTTDTLSDIQRILGINLINVQEKNEQQLAVFQVMVSSPVSDVKSCDYAGIFANKNPYYNSTPANIALLQTTKKWSNNYI